MYEIGAVTTRDSVNVPSFGKVYIYNLTTTPQNVIIMISGDGGWKFGVVGFSETFSEMNTLVIGVDILRISRISGYGQMTVIMLPPILYNWQPR